MLRLERPDATNGFGGTGGDRVEQALAGEGRAVELARGFQGEGPRAVATIAIARAVLEPKKVTKR